MTLLLEENRALLLRKPPPVQARTPRGRGSATARAIGCGLAVTLLQLAFAVLLLAPEGPLEYRYTTLVEHDSYWFANIVNRGYETIVPPISHKMMEVSNTAFFPAYPLAAAALRYGAHLSTEKSLLISAHLAAWGFWSYVFVFCRRWKVPLRWQFPAALAIAAHPAAFYLVAAYSESLFLMTLLGFLYWSAGETRRARVLAALHGVVMSGTRIVGLPCVLAPMVRRAWELAGRNLGDFRGWTKKYGAAVSLACVASLGGLAFFAYGQLRWGHWDIYMLTQQFGWGIQPDYLAIFRPSSYRWFIPALDNPTEASQLAMTLGGLILLVVISCEFLPRARQNAAGRSVRVTFYFTAFVLYFISVSGVAGVNMESMLRYQFCEHAVLVLALVHFFANVPLRSRLARAGAVCGIALASAAGLALESWYLWNFTRGNWVA
ncbi:MAG: hypothetical protein JO354_01550 [Verrucomicrobia bacterium]|nr:hypothetical protein [Verrucomicrobiota bacterium]